MTEIDFAGLDPDQRRRLQLVIAICLGVFLVEMSLSSLAWSQALKADALDFLAFGLADAVSLWALGRPADLRAGVKLVTAAVLFVVGLWTGLVTLYQIFAHPPVPEPSLIGAAALLALAANGVVLYLLRAPALRTSALGPLWFRARTDLVGSAAVMLAAGLVAAMASATPDLVVAGVLVVIFIAGAWQNLRQAMRDWEDVRASGPASVDTAPEPPKES